MLFLALLMVDRTQGKIMAQMQKLLYIWQRWLKIN